MKTQIQKLCRDKFGFTPIKGDIKIGPEKKTEDGETYRIVKIGDKEINIHFAIQCEEVPV